MTTTVQKWGNSIALRLPKAIAEEARIRQGSQVHIHVAGGRVVIVPDKGTRPRLKDLLAEVRPVNLHGEADWGSAKGREAW